ncbi:uncharacterized protein LOC115880624 isoform X2 [Sitophilus oryzae]|uniref:Uncharacterized protein LOC115880624 isoform X2 n=1 Tax=Sitophilus oryzae TaxID=7048 RepID=A0A6J2XQV5_SITOR|nr:uncharacterized protein LOC115880624 isoform X2 [Sitophilus oryzae]
MKNTRNTGYKYCIVPFCTSSTVKNPDKIFIRVPEDKKRRIKWLKACRRHVGDYSTKSTNIHVCEDHFNVMFLFQIAKDMDNFVRFKLMGGKKIMKSHVVPHIFDCQPDRKRTFSVPPRSAAVKRVQRRLVDQAVASCSTTTIPGILQTSVSPQSDEKIVPMWFMGSVMGIKTEKGHVGAAKRMKLEPKDTNEENSEHFNIIVLDAINDTDKCDDTLSIKNEAKEEQNSSNDEPSVVNEYTNSKQIRIKADITNEVNTTINTEFIHIKTENEQPVATKRIKLETKDKSEDDCIIILDENSDTDICDNTLSINSEIKEDQNSSNDEVIVIEDTDSEQIREKKAFKNKAKYNISTVDDFNSLDIKIDFKVIPPLHQVVKAKYENLNTTQKPTLLGQNQIDEQKLSIKTGRFTKDEDCRIWKNWDRFIMVHKLKNNPEMFCSLHDPKISDKNRQLFLISLAEGLPNRTLNNVYNRFKRLVSPEKIKEKEIFTVEEDEYIAKKMYKPKTELYKLASNLNKPYSLILHRISILKGNNRNKIIWTEPRTHLLVENLIRITNVNHYTDLRNRSITIDQFKALSNLMNIPHKDIKFAWLMDIHIRLFIPNVFCDLRSVTILLIKRLRESNARDWKSVKWQMYVKYFQGFTKEKLKSLISSLILTFVPSHGRTDYKYCLKELSRITSSNLKSEMIFKSYYKDGNSTNPKCKPKKKRKASSNVNNSTIQRAEEKIKHNSTNPKCKPEKKRKASSSVNNSAIQIAEEEIKHDNNLSTENTVAEFSMDSIKCEQNNYTSFSSQTIKTEKAVVEDNSTLSYYNKDKITNFDEMFLIGDIKQEQIHIKDEKEVVEDNSLSYYNTDKIKNLNDEMFIIEDIKQEKIHIKDEREVVEDNSLSYYNGDEMFLIEDIKQEEVHIKDEPHLQYKEARC